MLLDWIPRYGRTYQYDPKTRKRFSRKWSWFKPGQGLWGFYLLDRLGLLHEYMETWEWQEVTGEDGQVG